MTSVISIAESISFLRILGGIIMLTSLAYIFLAGLAAAAVCRFVKLPRIIGMLTVGVILGPHVLNVIDGSILGVQRI